ncbi:MAG: outer membrane beta-barrel protein [Elusimicrobiota bacterium]|jgi:hypothetical protein
MGSKTAAALCAALLLAGPSARAGGPEELRIVQFSDTLLLRVGSELVQLAPGSAGAAVPAGRRTEVLSGEATLAAAGVRLQVRPGAAFVYRCVPDGAVLSVEAGAVESVLSDGRLFPVAAGQTLRLGSLPAALEPPAALPERTPAETASRGPSLEPREPGFDPLDSLARLFEGLSRLKKPQLKLVLDLHPYYRLEQAYQSNIYRVPRDGAAGARVGGGVRSSWITTNNAGLKFELPFSRRHRLEGGYDAAYTAYTTQPAANNALKQTLRGEYVFSGVRGMQGKVWDALMSTVDPAFSETVSRERRLQNDFGARVDSARSRSLVWAAEGSVGAHKYRNPVLASSLDRREVLAGLEGGWLFQPKTKLYLAYKRGLIHYTAGRATHSRSHQASAGLSGKLAPKVTGKLEGSMLYREYEVSPGAGPRVVRNWLSAIQIDWQAGERNKVGLRMYRDMNQTTYTNNRYYVATGARLDLKRSWRRWSAGVYGSCEADTYPELTTSGGLTQRRKDDLWGAGLDMDWKLRSWLGVGTSYARVWKRSNFPASYDYDDDTTSVWLRLQF